MEGNEATTTIARPAMPATQPGRPSNMPAPEPILTRSEMESALFGGKNRLSEAEDGLAAAERKYRTLTAQHNYHTPEAHAASFAEHRPIVDEAQAELERIAAEEDARARRVLRQLQNGRITVSGADQQAALQRQPLVTYAVNTLDIIALRDEVAFAIMNDDVPSMYLFATLLPSRMQTAPDNAERMRPEATQARSELGRLDSQIRERLRDRSFDDLRTKTDGVLERTAKAKAATARRRAESEMDDLVKSGQRVRFPQPANR